MVIPPMWLMMPFFDASVTDTVNFAGLGRVLARAYTNVYAHKTAQVYNAYGR